MKQSFFITNNFRHKEQLIRRILSLGLAVLLTLTTVFSCGMYIAYAKDAPFEMQSPSYILMEASTGQVICESGADEERSPASITKLMTLLITFEQLKQGKLHLEDEVVTSAYAKSMGGSQVFLEEGEVQTVDTLLKCIAVASGNDASVAIAEKIAGSEEAFVQLMNEKASQLGLSHTHFVDCCGLTSSDEHYTSARDIALVARQLLLNYPEITKYSTIWMEDIVHNTKKGSSTFTLSSTNKLLKQYEYTTGLKTGSTDKAKYCFCGTAHKNNMDMIAVVMAAPDHKLRFEEARKLLEYGYEVSQIYEDHSSKDIPPLKLVGAMKDAAALGCAKKFSYLDVTGADMSKVEKKIEVPEMHEGEICKGEKVGQAIYYLSGSIIGKVDIVSLEDVPKAYYKDYLRKVFQQMLL